MRCGIARYLDLYVVYHVNSVCGCHLWYLGQRDIGGKVSLRPAAGGTHSV